jgi:DNA-3-methyladenine glycosylase II
VLSGRLDFDKLPADDEEAIAHLVAVKGIGRWTADIFLIVHLRRPDVLAVGDLEIRRTVERAYKLPGLPAPAELERLAEPWRPYRTLACLYLWQWAETARQT